MTVRSVTAIDLPGIVAGSAATARPEITWIAPTELLVDEAYQRNISEKGLRLIRRIVENFDWRRFKPPTCVWTSAGLEVIDGQHTAIAAASHPDISEIPVVVVEAVELKDRAGAFIGINRDRLGITNMQLHSAAVVAGDAEAEAIERICIRASIRILKLPPSRGLYKPRDTVAVQAIGSLIKRAGEEQAYQILKVLADADCTPVTSAALRAVEELMTGDDYVGQFDPVDLSRAIVALGVDGEKEAAVFAATHCIPKWRGLVAVWWKKVRKRRIEVATPAAPTATTIAPAAPEPAKRSTGLPISGTKILDWRGDGKVALGDPEPGRSELDRRNAKIAAIAAAKEAAARHDA